MNYDEALQRAETIITQLEQSEALSIDEYKKAAAEATALLKQCQEHLSALSAELKL